MTFWVGKCRVTVQFLFLAVLALLLAFDRNGIAAAGILCAAVHEGAHLAAMRLGSCRLQEVRLTPFGVDIVKKDYGTDRGYLCEALISLSGPAANLACFFLCYFLGNGRFSMFLAGNLAFFVLNILPIEPLDGGQALRCILCLRLSAGRAEKIVRTVSFFAMVPLFTAAFLVLFRSRWNFSLLLLCVYLTALLLMKKSV